jgi:hypothetical protein
MDMKTNILRLMKMRKSAWIILLRIESRKRAIRKLVLVSGLICYLLFCCISLLIYFIRTIFVFFFLGWCCRGN